MQKIKEEGFWAGIAYIPVLPFLSDSEEKLDEIDKECKRLCHQKNIKKSLKKNQGGCVRNMELK